MMESIWKQTTTKAPHLRLSQNMETEAVVIGAGMAGILTAHCLQQLGIHVIVLDSSYVGSGQTQNTTAKITAQHGLIYHKTAQTMGEEKAKQYATANMTALNAYRILIHKQQIDCDYEELPACLYTTSRKDSDSLKREDEQAQKLGIPSKYTTQATLPFAVEGALYFDAQAQFHPLKFLHALAKNLIVYEYTPVTSVRNHKVYTEHHVITADHIVFATHYPFLNVPGYYFTRMHQERSYVLALKHTLPLNAMYLGIGEDQLSFRNYKDLLLLGGGSHRTGKHPPGNKYEELRAKAGRFFPRAEEAACWSAQDCMTLDGLPYIGRFSHAAPNWYVATGFGKWGMSTSMIAAKIISALITKTDCSYKAVFSPGRFTPMASARNFIRNTGESLSGLVSPVFTGAPRCPHLGCRLTWNLTEKTWDCPCHGSRFSGSGELIDNPAQNNMAPDSFRGH